MDVGAGNKELTMDTQFMNTQFRERRSRSRDSVKGEPPRGALKPMIIGTFREMPGLSLHLPQAARLFNLRTVTCQVIFDDLIRQDHLQRAHDGQYRRPQ